LKTALRLLLPLSVLVAACGGGGTQVAATVNGVEITVDDVTALIQTADASIETTVFRTQLNNEIVWRAVQGAAEEQFGISATEEEVSEQYELFKTQLEANAATYEEALEANAITDLRVRQAAEQELVITDLREALSESAPEVSDEEIEVEFTTNDNQYRNACIKHILVETEEEAQTVKLRLDDGEDFATVAGEVSIEPQAAQTGGDLGCSNLARYVPEFSDGAEAVGVGVVSDPVESDFGWHVILVDSMDDDETVKSTIREQLAVTVEQNYFQEWITGVLTDAEVTVDEQYGSWATDPQPGIVPPTTEAPATPSTEAPASTEGSGG